MAAPHYIDLEALMDERFHVREKIQYKGLRSLTRVIRLLRRSEHTVTLPGKL